MIVCRVWNNSDLYIQVKLDLILVKECVMYLQLLAKEQIESSSQQLQKILSRLLKKIYSVSSVRIVDKIFCSCHEVLLAFTRL